MSIPQSQVDSENFNTKVAQPKIFIPNKSGHDFSDCLRYGTPIYVTKGIVNRFSVNLLAREWELSLRESSKDDFILITSLTILTTIGAALFSHKHGTLNLLLFLNGRYIARKLDFLSLLSLSEEEEENEED